MVAKLQKERFWGGLSHYVPQHILNNGLDSNTAGGQTRQKKTALSSG